MTNEDVLNLVAENLPMDLNVIELYNISTLSNGAVTVDVTYPMEDDDFTETLCFNNNLNAQDILIHLEERVRTKYSALNKDEMVKENLEGFFKMINRLLQA